jgi:nicotinamidase-related amidase
MKVLVVVDMQNDFVTGTLGSKQAKTIIPNVIAKIKKYQDNGDVVIFTRDTHYPDYLTTQEGKNLPVEHCIKGTWGWEIVDGLMSTALPHEIYDKNTFGSKDLMNELYKKVTYDGAEEIEFIGLCTDICVVSNALGTKAYVPEAPIKVDAACCAGVTPFAHDAAITTMKSCQIEILNMGKEPWRRLYI